MKLTKNQQKLRFKILDKIYSKGPISRIDISKETGITPATVSEITGNMIQENIIHELGEVVPEESKSGHKKILLGVSPEHSFYIGTELSPKYISFCLADNTGKIFKKNIISLDNSNFEEILSEDFYINELKKFINSCEDYNPKGIGIALPGHFDEVNKSIISNNLFWKNFNLKDLLDKIDLPICFENNVKCMTLAERLFTFNGTDDNFIFFHVGRGMFCSYMYNGELYAKDNFLVGEIGHIIVHPNGELCECGKRGCLQTYGSEAWIIKKSQILFDNSETTYLKQLVSERNKINIETILKAYKLGDEGIIKILHSAINYLSITINNLSMMIDSSKIIIHGELFNEDLLRNLLEELLNQNINLLSKNKKQDIIIKSYNNYNGALAASALCVSKLLIDGI
ncbi:ROK family transcriptional regulator [Clostridium sp.]|uniref:ROK family transcriptional regulator n=1 Tax=Clostridium sp. TaxID=1506 RepID=UPI00290F44ED|nr:ROK family transcriptional regulator [Clostridium sp.]MDU5107843.1 ROK family transcriptional regulator [Clostridium sp.]